MIKCPRCENENLKEDYNYCPVCGELINKQLRETSINMLKAMRENYLNCEFNDEEEKKYLALTVGALDVAIKELERTAPEVPVQEQYVKNIVSKELFEIEKKRYKELKLFYFMNMLMFICLAFNSIGMLIQ